MPETFGTVLKQLRERVGLSQPDLAKASTVPLGTIRSIEQGRRSPVFATAVHLARAMGVSLDELAASVEDVTTGRATSKPATGEPIKPKTAGRPRKTPEPVAEDTAASKTRKGKK
jgi:putative transcriptional regulator